MTSTSWEVPEDENLDSWLERDDTWRYLRECDENRLIRLLDIMIRKYATDLYTLYTAKNKIVYMTGSTRDTLCYKNSKMNEQIMILPAILCSIGLVLPTLL
jgi:hypothetical protein